MKMVAARFISVISLCVLVFVGCESVSMDYVGKTYPPTAVTDVSAYYDKSDVPQGYKVMGQAICTAPEGLTGQTIEQEIVKEAASKGADAVIIGEAKEVVTGATTWNHNYYGGFGNPYFEDYGPAWEFGGDEWAAYPGFYNFGPSETVIDYALKIKVLLLKK